MGESKPLFQTPFVNRRFQTMKILYGIQATGNGHITRARAIGKEFSRVGANVDYLFSGRSRGKFFDMDIFNNWKCYSGLTFRHHEGRISPLRTFRNNRLMRFWRDVHDLDLSDYDLVVTDFEPITAWAAKLAGKTSIGVGHQYAFNSYIPMQGDNWGSRLIMRRFAPVNIPLGLHWHHFDQNILPPIADTPPFQPLDAVAQESRKIIVYLGFESQARVIELLQPFEDYKFYYYGDFPDAKDLGHIQLRPLSRDGFQRDLNSSAGVICNAGFELASEALQLGKKLLVKPLYGQMEQLSNAFALEQLQLGMTMKQLCGDRMRAWLDSWESKQIIYPNVAKAIVQWILEGDWSDSSELVKALWPQVRSPQIANFAALSPN